MEKLTTVHVIFLTVGNFWKHQKIDRKFFILIGKNFVGEDFRWGKYSIPRPKVRHYSPMKFLISISAWHISDFFQDTKYHISESKG